MNDDIAVETMLRLIKKQGAKIRQMEKLCVAHQLLMELLYACNPN